MIYLVQKSMSQSVWTINLLLSVVMILIRATFLTTFEPWSCSYLIWSKCGKCVQSAHFSRTFRRHNIITSRNFMRCAGMFGRNWTCSSLTMWTKLGSNTMSSTENMCVEFHWNRFTHKIVITKKRPSVRNFTWCADMFGQNWTCSSLSWWTKLGSNTVAPMKSVCAKFNWNRCKHNVVISLLRVKCDHFSRFPIKFSHFPTWELNIGKYECHV